MDQGNAFLVLGGVLWLFYLIGLLMLATGVTPENLFKACCASALNRF